MRPKCDQKGDTLLVTSPRRGFGGIVIVGCVCSGQRQGVEYNVAMEGYLTVEGVGESLFEDRKSRFYGFVTHIDAEQDVVEFRHGIMRDIPDASHYCSAYRIQKTGVDHYSDAKEPHGTAGMPILNVLQHRGLQDVVCVVARIFGGTLLGKGGLVRAYTQAASDACDAATIVRCIPCCDLIVSVDYAQYDALVARLAQMGIAPSSVSYAENVTIVASVAAVEAEFVADQVRDFCHGRARVIIGPEHMGTVPLDDIRDGGLL